MAENTFRGLGRGLDALIPGGNSIDDAKEGLQEVAINLIDVNPYQPRTSFNEDELADLSASIKKHGVLQPLVVTPKGDHFELIAGERRLRASKLAGLAMVPVIVRDVEDHDKLEIALIENVQRSNLNAIDEALSYRKLIEEFNYTQDQVAEGVGKSRAAVANKIRLLALPVEIKRALKDGKITEGHAKALLSIEDPKKQQAVFNSILTGELNVRDTEAKVNQIKNGHVAVRPNGEEDESLKQLADDLKAYLGTKVAIKRASRGGKIEIDFYSTEELTRVYQKIKGID